MTDYGHPCRAKLLGPKQHYQSLIAKGVSEVDATNMSGYHPLQEFEKSLGFWLKTMAAFAACYFLISLALGYDRASAALTGAEESERVLVACLNGSPIHAGDDWYYCVKMGELK